MEADDGKDESTEAAKVALATPSSPSGPPTPATPSTPLGPPTPTPACSAEPPFRLTSRAAADRLLWIDLEMTNIADPSRGRIMEVGAVVTGPTMAWLRDEEEMGGPCTMYHRVIRLTPEELAASSEWSMSHHARRRPGCGLSLMQLCAVSSFSLQEVEEDLITMVRLHGGGRPMMLAGSSVACDRVFIDRHMPRLASVLHHRTVDVSTVLELCRRMYPGFRVPSAQHGASSHTAMGDIISSLRLMHWLQNTVFMPGLLSPDFASPPGHGMGGGGGGGGGGGYGSSSMFAHPYGQQHSQQPHQAHHHAYQPHYGAPQYHPPPWGGPGSARPFVLRQAPPSDGSASPSATSTNSFASCAGNILLAATASHGFPMQRRVGTGWGETQR